MRPGGRITRDDVLDHIDTVGAVKASKPAAPPSEQPAPPDVEPAAPADDSGSAGRVQSSARKTKTAEGGSSGTSRGRRRCQRRATHDEVVKLTKMRQLTGAST